MERRLTHETTTIQTGAAVGAAGEGGAAMKYKPGDKVFVKRRGEWVAGVYDFTAVSSKVYWVRFDDAGSLPFDADNVIDRSDLPNNERWYRCDECSPGCNGRENGFKQFDQTLCKRKDVSAYLRNQIPWRRDHEKEARLMKAQDPNLDDGYAVRSKITDEILASACKKVKETITQAQALVEEHTADQDPPFILEIGKTYYAARSKRTKMYLTKKYEWMISYVTQCLHITEYLARCASEHATDPEGNPEPVEIVKIRLVCEGVV